MREPLARTGAPGIGEANQRALLRTPVRQRKGPVAEAAEKQRRWRNTRKIFCATHIQDFLNLQDKTETLEQASSTTCRNFTELGRVLLCRTPAAHSFEDEKFSRPRALQLQAQVFLLVDLVW